MRIKIAEVTFNTEFAPKKPRASFKVSGGSYYQCKKEKLLLDLWNYFFSRSILLIESIQILNTNILISKEIWVIYL